MQFLPAVIPELTEPASDTSAPADIPEIYTNNFCRNSPRHAAKKLTGEVLDNQVSC